MALMYASQVEGFRRRLEAADFGVRVLLLNHSFYLILLFLSFSQNAIIRELRHLKWLEFINDGYIIPQVFDMRGDFYFRARIAKR